MLALSSFDIVGLIWEVGEIGLSTYIANDMANIIRIRLCIFKIYATILKYIYCIASERCIKELIDFLVSDQRRLEVCFHGFCILLNCGIEFSTNYGPLSKHLKDGNVTTLDKNRKYSMLNSNFGPP